MTGITVDEVWDAIQKMQVSLSGVTAQMSE
jgi:hypothetical protein